MASPDENKALIRFLIEEALNRRNFAVAADRFTPDYTVHIPARPDLPAGPDVFRQVIGMWHDAFDDWHMTIEQLVAEGDFVANRFTTRGTHTGTLMGIPPTGQRMVVSSQELHRLRDGKVAESWIVDDVPGILVQLGVLPAPPMAAAGGGGPPAPGG
ncbi:MAG: ester cyclase [Thermoleophilia bacterium]|nr:ester cyclase [Thermoleophilia bacterium]